MPFSNMMNYYGFVYKWTNVRTGKMYIGSHHGKDDDGYIGSGVYFKKAYNKEPEAFTREILEYNIISDDGYITYGLEQKYLDKIANIHLNESYYNLSPYAEHPGGWNRGLEGFKSSEEKKNKISNYLKEAHKSGKRKKAYEGISKSKIGKTKENNTGRLITSKKMAGNQNSANRLDTPKGKIWINKDGVSKMIRPAELEIYKDWNKGRK